jgi:hypothetical protein
MDPMQDLVYVASLFAFFGLATLFVIACDKIIGPDEAALAEEAAGPHEPTPEIEQVAA